jgi:hypothetical protein
MVMAGLLSWNLDALPAARSAQPARNASYITSTVPRTPSRAAGSCFLQSTPQIIVAALIHCGNAHEPVGQDVNQGGIEY